MRNLPLNPLKNGGVMRRRTRSSFVLSLVFCTVPSAVVLSSCYTALKQSDHTEYRYRSEDEYVPPCRGENCSACHPVCPEPPPPPPSFPVIDPPTESKPTPVRDQLRPPGSKEKESKDKSRQKEKR